MVMSETYENELHGQGGAFFQIESLREFQKFDTLLYLEGRTDKEKAYLLKLSEIIFTAIVQVADEVEDIRKLSAGDWASVIQLIGGKIVQHSSILMFEDSKKDMT